MIIAEKAFIKGFVRMAVDGWNKGWHERNGGNLTYRLTNEEASSIKNELLDKSGWLSIGTSVPKLAKEYFVVTGMGKHFRNMELCPEENIGIVEIDETGKNYRIVWGFGNNARPTSELPSHLMNHEVKISSKGDSYRAIYHCHPSNLITLTFVLPLDEKVFTRALWESMTECPIVFPDGVGVIPWMVPGGREIAVESAHLMEKQDVVVWAHHGVFCAGKDFDTAFGLAETVEKSAEILVKILSISPNKLQTITSDDFRKLEKPYNVKIDSKFLS